MTRLMVLGARGFLGSHVAARAREHPDVAEVLTPWRHELDLDAGPGAVSQFLLRKWPDVVVLCTGRLSGTVGELTAAHASAVATVVDAIGAAGRPCRVVRLGSAGEYGPVRFGESVTESDPTWPATAYGASHLSATHLLRAATLEGVVSGTTLRVFNPVGAGGHGPTLASEVAQRIRDAVESGSSSISTGPLTTWRDLVDAQDVARAVLAAALTPAFLPPVINVGSGRAVSSREIVTTLAAVAGWSGRADEHDAAPGRSAGVGWMQADVRLASRVLGWAPQRPLVDSLTDVWRGTDRAGRNGIPALIQKENS